MLISGSASMSRLHCKPLFSFHVSSDYDDGPEGTVGLFKLRHGYTSMGSKLHTELWSCGGCVVVVVVFWCVWLLLFGVGGRTRGGGGEVDPNWRRLRSLLLCDVF